ncbi:MAG: hypothetical protein GKR91_15760 [Pseudomonadales bacterium]|nr:hypothetical protein [Pseudomonadales bacterium]
MGQYNLRQHLSTITPASTLSRFIGPIDNCSDTVWGQLTDFSNWSTWSSQIQSVERLDAGSVGRGSVLAVSIRNSVQHWQIEYWNPGKRVDFIIEYNGRRSGYSFVFNGPSDEQHVELRLQMEFEYSGLRSLVSGFLSRLERKKAMRLFEEFVSYIQELST